jgi:alpha-amylase
LDIGQSDSYFDEELNRKILNKVSQKCYLPTNRLLMDLIERFEGRFKVAFSITGTFIDQLKQFRPDVLCSFKRLAETGAVEFLGETYYHSLSFLFDGDEFVEQVRMHSRLMEDEFGYSPVTFRNTELIYSNKVSDLVSEMPEFRTILTEGADKILHWRSPLYAYHTYSKKQLLLLKYYSLSDDIAFRFSNRNWSQFPLTVEKFTDWLEKLPLIEGWDRNLYVNLFLDYETFGEHQWSDTGIFEFVEHLPGHVLKNGFIRFCQPCEAWNSLNYEPAEISVEEPISWADSERDMSAWLSNPLQFNAINTYYGILRQIKKNNRTKLLETARKLSTSDLYYYMCTKYFQDGDVHKYFSPYSTPEQAYIYFMNILADLEKRVEEEEMLA